MILDVVGLVVIITLVYIVFNLLKKVETLEDIVLDQQEYMKKVSIFIQESEELINTIDERGTFRSDDEVGNFFNYLKSIQEVLTSYKVTKNDGKKTR